MQHTSETLRVILVGNDFVTLGAMRKMIRSASDQEIVAEAWSLDRAGEVIALLEPNVVVIDVSSLGDEGVKNIQQLRATYSDVHVVAISSKTDPLFAERIVRAGALGYLVTPTGMEALPDAIRSVVRENAYVSRRIARSILTRMIQVQVDELTSKLTGREREIFHLLGSLDVDQISEHLDLTRRTVVGYCRRIRAKLDLASASELIECARRRHSEHA